MIRKGACGGTSELLTPEQQTQIDHLNWRDACTLRSDVRKKIISRFPRMIV
jgi:hypothetical protein